MVTSDVRPWRYPPRMDFQYGDWMRAEFEAGDLEPWPSAVNPDLALLVTMVLQSDAVVFGHSHMPLLEAERGFQIFNPGSPTERRRAPARTMGIAAVEAGAIRFEHLTLR